MKNIILTISIIFLLLIFLFINNSVFAAETTNTLIVDGYDMSFVYKIYDPEEAFFIYKYDGTYWVYIHWQNTDFAYNKIRDDGLRIGMYNSEWSECPDTSVGSNIRSKF